MRKYKKNVFTNNLAIKNFAEQNNLAKFLYKNYLRTKVNLTFRHLDLNKVKNSMGVNLNVLGIEFTNICDLRCKWCSLDHEGTIRKRGYMEVSTLKKILDEVIKKENHVGHIALHHAGETTLHPKFEEMMNLIGSYKRKYKDFPFVSLLTNANLLNERKSKIIIDSGAINWIKFSIDGGNKKDFEEMRSGANWERVMKNVNYFLDINRNIIGTAVFTLIKKEKNFTKEFRGLIKRVDEHKINKPHNWAGDVKVPFMKFNKESGGCWRIFKSMDILWDGSVTRCCADLNAQGKIGNLNHNTLKEIYTGRQRLYILEKMKQNKRSEINYCQNCSEL